MIYKLIYVAFLKRVAAYLRLNVSLFHEVSEIFLIIDYQLLNELMFKELPNIGITEDHSLYEVKIRRWFNIVTTFGILTAIIQAIFVSGQDILASIFHLIWGTACVIGLLLHAHHNFSSARFVSCLFTLVFGGLASARIGHEYYPHFASFGILIAVFIFYDLKKEWQYVLFFLLIEIIILMIVETNYFKADTVFFKNAQAARSFTLIGTILFVCFEIWYLVRLSWLNENYINTELHRTNEKLQLKNRENTVMLQEIHHRVKNNFQIISSLVKLQANKLESDHSKDIFDDLCSRIMSISMMHEKIYQSDNMAQIDFRDYIESLANRIIENYSIRTPVKINVSSDIKSMNNQAIVPIALILNELITNSLKHAFLNTNSPEIYINFSKSADTHYNLIFQDNGKWLEEKVDSFGLELIASLTEQLSGNFERQSGEVGTTYVFKFKDQVDSTGII